MTSTIQPTLLGRRSDGRPIYEIAGGAPEPPAPPAPPAPAPPAPPAPPPAPAPPAPAPPVPRADGYPADTPVADMAPAEQTAYWRAQARKHEERVKAFGTLTPDEAKSLVKGEEQRRKDALTEQERQISEAVDKATSEAKAAERALFAPQLVTAKFEAAAAGRLTKAQLAAITEDVDPKKYLTDTGEVDSAKVQKKVDALAPAAPRMPNLGQGTREPTTDKGVAAGRERYEEQRRKKSPSNT